jgi:hypothetical protein
VRFPRQPRQRSTTAATKKAHLGRINVFYHGASGGKYVPRAVLFDSEVHLDRINVL